MEDRAGVGFCAAKLKIEHITLGIGQVQMLLAQRLFIGTTG